jgi:hypothetical protein
VKFTPLLEAPFTATITGPVLASGGTGTTILVSDHEAGVAVNPLKEMVLAPLSAPKLVPVTVIESPAIPEFVDKLVIKGVTTKVPVLLATVFTVTETLAIPAGKPPGTGATIAVSLQTEGVTVMPPTVTGLKFWAVPKPLPLIVRALLTGPDAGVILVIFGVM